MDQFGDIAILRAQLTGAEANARVWLAVAQSEEEKVYIRLMQERLGDLQRILDRIELRGKRDEQNRWEDNVRGLLGAFRGASEARGRVVGSDLSALAARLGKQSPEEKRPLAWQEIEITFLSDERVEIRSGSNGRTNYNYGELGLEDRRSGKPSQAWIMLRLLAESGGEMLQPPAGRGRAKAQKRIEEIREKLRSHFKIDGDPVPFNGSTYKASFKISRRRSFDT